MGEHMVLYKTQALKPQNLEIHPELLLCFYPCQEAVAKFAVSDILSVLFYCCSSIGMYVFYVHLSCVWVRECVCVCYFIQTPASVVHLQ